MKLSNHNPVSVFSCPHLICSLLLCANAGAVMAALGQAPTPFTPTTSSAAVSPVASKRAISPTMASGLYSVQGSQLDNGTVVQEYITPAGIVFALTWRGPVLPDLSTLLGDYFQTFKNEIEKIRNTGRRASSLTVQNNGLIVQSSGRMGKFFGHAYAPDLIPTGVKINEVIQ
jgi:hypothetical protein